VKQDTALSAAERAVFGDDAVRGPDGNIIERGIRWSGSSPEAVAAAQPEEWPAAPVPATPAAPPPPEPRTIDLRAVHPCPERTQ
jgi:hypothetical protein